MGEHPIDRLRRYFCDDCFKNHLKTYSKRPIYWLFDSGEKKACRALLYMHRYDTESVARVRLQYVQVLQRQYAQWRHQTVLCHRKFPRIVTAGSPESS